VSFCAHAILSEDLFEVADAALDPRFSGNPFVETPQGLRYYIGAPVRAPNGLPVGALCLFDTAPRQLNAEQRHTLRDFADILQDELTLRNDSVRDHLTRLYNRRFADELIDREVRRAYRARLPLTLLLIDVDHFKHYNDRFGHLAGDEALRRVAREIGKVCRRPGDLAARFGGEEFVAVFPLIDFGGAQTLAENLRRDVAALAIEHPDTPEGRLTVSIGGIIANDRRPLGLTGDALLARADALLYEAKQAGRNQVLLKKLEE
jgi:diguanylate cyclase (GGDEF)-like protein